MLEKQSVFGLAQSSKLQLGFQGLSLTLYSSPHWMDFAELWDSSSEILQNMSGLMIAPHHHLVCHK